jgi:hypothetical protein
MSDSILPMRWAGIAYTMLLLLTLVAFWPSYISVPMDEYSAWFHLHAVAATLWLFILIAQPITIQSGRKVLHRSIGLTSLVLMPILPISILGVAHTAMQGTTGPEFEDHAYLLYDSVVLGSIFVTSYVMGILKRRNTALHIRYMICIGLTLIDPVVDRLARRVLDYQEFNYKMLTYGLICLILAILIWKERRTSSGHRHVFPIILAAFFIGGLPLALNFYTWGTPWELWKLLSARFAAF